MPDPRYGVYLLPAPPLAAAVAAVHARLAEEHGSRGGRLMPHVTLKGFFRTGAEPAELETRLRTALRGRPAVTLHNAGPVALGPDTVALDVDKDPAGGRNGALRALHVAVFDVMAP